MKLKYIILLVLAAVGVGIVLSTYGDSSQYASFDTAKQNPGKSFHVVGKLDRSKPMRYDPLVDPNRFEFFLVDSMETSCKVIYHQPKPADFERSQNVVVKGNYQNGIFEAKEILLKCPSKYNDATVATTE